jgi:hypothetical protein
MTMFAGLDVGFMMMRGRAMRPSPARWQLTLRCCTRPVPKRCSTNLRPLCAPMCSPFGEPSAPTSGLCSGTRASVLCVRSLGRHIPWRRERNFLLWQKVSRSNTAKAKHASPLPWSGFKR